MQGKRSDPSPYTSAESCSVNGIQHEQDRVKYASPRKEGQVVVLRALTELFRTQKLYTIN